MTTETITKQWNEIPFADCLQKVKLGREKQIKEKDYLKVGEYPIVDQGQSVIAGYTNDGNKVISDILPFIIFGDHTRILKYIDFPIALGADGTKVIKPKNIFDEKFFFYFLKQLDIPSRGYNRHYTILKEKNILQPPLPEQKSISRVLTTIQDAITGQEELISKLNELKRGMMQHLFTYGTKGEQTKMTEIGEVPESWDVVMLGKIADIQQGKQVSKKNRIGNNQKPFLRTANIFWNKIDLSVLDKMNFSVNEEKKFKLNYGDLLVCEGGAVGRTSMWKDEMSGCYYQNHLHRVRVNENMDSSFLLYWLNYALEFTEIYFGRANNTTIPNLAKSKLQQFEIPLPDIKEQNNISSTLISIDQKIESVQDKLLVYQNLFNTLLHELMSGERRI